MAPRDTAHEIHQLLIALKRISGLLLDSNQSALLELCGQLANKANSGTTDCRSSPAISLPSSK
jgi:hypothetical protein